MSAQLERLAGRLYPESAADARQFIAAIGSGSCGRGVAVWPGSAPALAGLPEWRPDWIGPPAGAGESGYGLDFSSVWEMAALTVVPRPVRRLLDLCAAPGGKSVLAARWVVPEFHLANELVPKRLAILRHNLGRCGVRAFTQRQRPEWWAAHGAGCFDLVIVDAPCSGQSLPARGVRNPGCFHPAVVSGNAKRQRGILARAAATVAAGGRLIYATCTFSVAENERNVAWFVRHHPDWSPVAVPALADWRSPHTELACYRLGPHQGLGAGGFVTVLARGGEPSELRGLPPDAGLWPVPGSRSS
jgi:16S rRNA C967 or C1407 C5-methylase (RsmB/RsmF family)